MCTKNCDIPISNESLEEYIKRIDTLENREYYETKTVSYGFLNYICESLNRQFKIRNDKWKSEE